MRRLIDVLGLLTLAIALLALLIPQVVPGVWLRDQLVAVLTSATGGMVRIDGPIGWQLVPRPLATVRGVVLTGLERQPALTRVAIAEIDTELGLLDLLRGDVVVRRLQITGLDAEVDLAATSAPLAPVPPPLPLPPSGAVPPVATAEAPHHRLHAVNLINGRVTVRDGGTIRRVEGIDGEIRLDEALRATLAARLDGRAIDLTVDAAAAADFLAGGTTPISAALTGDGLEVRFEGGVSRDTAAGSLSFAAAPAGAVLDWLAGAPLSLPFDQFRLASEVAAGPSRVALEGLRASLDALEVDGALALDLETARPRLTGELALGAVALPLRQQPPASAAGNTGASPPPIPAQVPAAPDAAGWSDAPLPAPSVPLDLDVAVTIERIAAGDVVAGPGALRLTGSDGDATATIERIALHGGELRGNLAYQPRDGALGLAATVEADGVQIEPLLRRTGVGGTAVVRLDATAAGRSERELVAALDGRGSVAASGVRLRGLDREPELASLLQLLSLGTAATGELALGNASASFTIADGIVANDDLVATTPTLRVTGAGTVDLPARRIPRYVFIAEPTVPLDRLGPLSQLQGLLVPVVIEGPFDHLTATPDTEAAVNDALRRLLQPGNGDGAKTPEQAIQEGVGKLLRGLGIRP